MRSGDLSKPRDRIVILLFIHLFFGNCPTSIINCLVLLTWVLLTVISLIISFIILFFLVLLTLCFSKHNELFYYFVRFVSFLVYLFVVVVIFIFLLLLFFCILRKTNTQISIIMY